MANTGLLVAGTAFAFSMIHPTHNPEIPEIIHKMEVSMSHYKRGVSQRPYEDTLCRFLRIEHIHAHRVAPSKHPRTDKSNGN